MPETFFLNEVKQPVDLERFVLKPLLELAPDYIHPLLKKTIMQLETETTDTLEAYPVPRQPLETKIPGANS